MSTATTTIGKADNIVNVTNKPAVLAAIKRAAELKQIEKAGKDAEAERKRLEETIIRPALGGAKYAVLRGVKAVTVCNSSNSNIDAAKLLAGWPEAHAACYVKTPYTFLRYSL